LLSPSSSNEDDDDPIDPDPNLGAFSPAVLKSVTPSLALLNNSM
jgi:hypothetical protein